MPLVCFTGAGFLLQAEGARLTDEERARSFGNHQTEPAVDGQQPVYAPKMALTVSVLFFYQASECEAARVID